MTATLTPPPAPPPAPAPRATPGSPPAIPARAPRRAAGPWVAEILLLAVTLVAVAGFARLFADRAAVTPLLVAAVAAHLVGAIARRRGWGALPTAAVTLAAFAVEATLVLYPHTSAYGLPTPATLDAVGHDLSRAWDLFGEVRAPAPRSRGFLLASSLTLWVAVALADWAAFRLRTIAEAVLPAGAVFVFTTLLGRGRGGVVLTALLVAAVLAFAAAQRAGRSGRDDAWVGGRSRAGTVALGRSGVLVALVVAAVAGIVGPRLPTAGDEPLVDWRGEHGPDARTTVSPLVDIRSRLVEQSNRTVFLVESDRPAYWRLTSLDLFDGQVWASSERFGEADGDLPSEPPGATTAEVRQEFTIRELGSIWAPAALTPVELVESTEDLRWNGELATLIVPQGTPEVDGIRYTVVSQVPSFTPEDLDARQPADEDLPDEVREATELPGGLPPIVAQRAAEAVAGAGDTPYERARALQDWFRSNFVYDLDVGAGHSGNAIETFLRNGRGYCEQFAGTYAAMARTLGLPARVAVGFTQGQRTGVGYTVRGRNAHAWPEVWISGAGWVPFEPTPTRGQPGAEQYTGVQAQQDDRNPDLPTTEPATTSTAPPATGSTQVPQTTIPRGEVVTEPGADPGAATDDGAPAWLVAVLVLLAAGLVLLVVDVAAIALVRRRRTRGHGADHSVAGRVRSAWGHALGALRLVGVAPAPAETAREFAHRAGDDLGEAGPALTRLAGMVTTTTWAPAGVHADDALAGQADELAGRVTHKVRSDAGWKPRFKAAVDPRTLRSP